MKNLFAILGIGLLFSASALSGDIVTSWSSGSVSTTKQTGQSTERWIAVHWEAVNDATVTGTTLDTTYDIDNQGTEEIDHMTTQKETGESTVDFVSRHILVTGLEMKASPPVP